MDLNENQVLKFTERALIAFIDEIKDSHKEKIYLKDLTPEDTARVFVRNWFDSKKQGTKKCPNCGTYNYHFSVVHNSWTCAFC